MICERRKINKNEIDYCLRPEGELQQHKIDCSTSLCARSEVTIIDLAAHALDAMENSCTSIIENRAITADGVINDKSLEAVACHRTTKQRLPCEHDASQ